MNDELDARVAEDVMGWRVHHRNTAHYVFPGMREYKVQAVVSEWHPSIDIATAMRVVEKLQADGWTVTLALRQFEQHVDDRAIFHGCRFVLTGGVQHIQSFSEHAELAPEAICKGALAAVSPRWTR